MNIIQTPDAPQAIGPYAQAVAVDGWLFTSGQIPLNAAGELVEGDVTVQTTQVLDNLHAVLTGQAKMADLVKAKKAKIIGNGAKLEEIIACLDNFDLWVNIVTPN